MQENKQDICDALLYALQKTRNMNDLKSLKYVDEKEIVVAEFDNSYKKSANVAADSGTAMIIDIVRQII